MRASRPRSAGMLTRVLLPVFIMFFLISVPRAPGVRSAVAVACGVWGGFAVAQPVATAEAGATQIGRASCRERVYVLV